MSRKTKWNASYAVRQIGNQSRVVCKMGMQMINLFPDSLFLRDQKGNEVYGLKEAIPAVAGGIALIDHFIDRNINQGMEIALEMQSSHLKVLNHHVPQRSRLNGCINVPHWGLDPIQLLLNNLLMRVGQGKDLDRYADLFQSQDLVQNKGL